MKFHWNSTPFYLTFCFCVSKQCFFIYIFLCDTVQEAQKYEVTIWLEEPKKNQPEKQSFQQKILSIDELWDLEDDVPASHYVEIPYQQMTRFFAMSYNDDSEDFPHENGKYTVVLPVQVEQMKKEDA